MVERLEAEARGETFWRTARTWRRFQQDLIAWLQRLGQAVACTRPGRAARGARPVIVRCTKSGIGRSPK